MKIPRVFYITVIVGFLLFLSWFLLLGLNAPMSCFGFAVDSSQNIYLAYNEQIQVFDTSGTMIRRITPTTSRGYDITIENDQIILAHYPDVCKLDLEGNVLEKTELDDYDDFPRIPTWTDTDPQGNTYVLKRLRFPIKIYLRTDHGDQCVFTAPLSNMIPSVIFILCGLFLFVMVPITFAKWYNINPPKSNSLTYKGRSTSNNTRRQGKVQ